MGYVAVKRFLHDGERYQIGDAAPKLSGAEKRRLVELGVIESQAEEPSEDTPKAKPAAKDSPAKAEVAASANDLPPGVSPDLQ